MLINQPTAAPTRKVAAGGRAGLLTVILIATINHFVPGAGEVLGPEVAAALVAVVSPVVAWWVRERPQQHRS